MNNSRDSEILQRYLDGIASAEDVQQLSARLREDVKARQEFITLLNLDSALADVAQSVGPEGSVSLIQDSLLPSGLEEFTTNSDSTVRTGGSIGRRFGWAAVCVMLLSGVGWWRHSFAQVRATVQSRVGSGPLAEGTVLRGESHTIQAGIVQLVTSRGARIVIEAPAEFRFESADRLRMIRGRLSAEVSPAAKGFTVVTPSGEAIDLGTRFGVDVPAAGPAEIHVFQGEVIARASGADASDNLYGGDAVTLAHGVSKARELRSAAFIDALEMSELTAGVSSGQQARSDALNATLRNDPDLIALLDFESGNVRPGVFRMAQGRWPGSQAPEFVTVGDHMKLDIGGDRDWPQLTLAAWVRLDRLGEPFQSLLHTDGWDQNKTGQVHWMVTAQTTMRLALYGNTLAPGSDEQFGYPDSRTPVHASQGRWVHLATVYDATTRTVRFYLNGRFDKETKQAVAHPAKLGPAQIGNWNRFDRKLSGRIDELILLGRAMSDHEIETLYAAGCPYR